jgi:hypothetical protein
MPSADVDDARLGREELAERAIRRGVDSHRHGRTC